jgi:hypothetical protein
MLKGKQKKLDKNKDGKISGEDFKMMKAKYGKMAKKPGGAVLGVLALGAAGALGGKKLLSKKRDTASVAPGAKAASSATPMRSKLLQKAMDDGIFKKAKSGKMMKAKKGGGADMGKKDYKLGLEMQGDYKGKDIKGKAKEFISTALKQNKGSISKVLKKLAGSQVSDKEAKEIRKLLPSAPKEAKKGKMMKAKSGKMIEANMGMEAKSTQGYGAARTSGMGLEDENLIPGKSLDYYKDVM